MKTDLCFLDSTYVSLSIYYRQTKGRENVRLNVSQKVV